MLPLRVRVDLGAMAGKGYSAFPKPPALLKPHIKLFSVISRTFVGGSLTPVQRYSTAKWAVYEYKYIFLFITLVYIYIYIYYVHKRLNVFVCTNVFILCFLLLCSVLVYHGYTNANIHTPLAIMVFIIENTNSNLSFNLWRGCFCFILC